MLTLLKRTFALAATLFGLLAVAVPASAGPSVAAPTSYPLYCQGRLDFGRGDTFLWTTTIAKNAGPGPEQCSWPDRVARGEEIHSGPNGNYGLLCPLGTYSSALRQFDKGQYFIVNVASVPVADAGNRPACLTVTSAPTALTPENRPWPVAKNPADGPKPANMH